MLSGKRKQGFGGLQRRVRPRREQEEEPEIEETFSSEPEEMGVEGDEMIEDEEDEDEMDDEEEVNLTPLMKPRLDANITTV